MAMTSKLCYRICYSPNATKRLALPIDVFGCVCAERVRLLSAILPIPDRILRINTKHHSSWSGSRRAQKRGHHRETDREIKTGRGTGRDTVPKTYEYDHEEGPMIWRMFHSNDIRQGMPASRLAHLKKDTVIYSGFDKNLAGVKSENNFMSNAKIK